MTLFDAAASTLTNPDEGSTRPTRWARAYCGPAHGHTWALPTGESVTEHVEVAANGHTHFYRLVYDLRAHRPARDDFGHWMYLPASTAAGRRPNIATATSLRAAWPHRRRRIFWPATTSPPSRREVP